MIFHHTDQPPPPGYDSDDDYEESLNETIQNEAVSDTPEQPLGDDAIVKRVKLKDKIPRIYFFLAELLLPLFLLIGMAFLFGWGLAKFEMVGEIETNDGVVGENLYLYIAHVLRKESTWHQMGRVAATCGAELELQPGIEANQTDLYVPDASLKLLLEPSHPLHQQSQYLYECGVGKGQEVYQPIGPVHHLAHSGMELTFDWMSCPTDIVDDHDEITHAINLTDDTFDAFGLNPEDQHDRQYLAYINHFAHDMNVRIHDAGLVTEEVLADIDLLLDFADQATGSKGCKVHTAGGALFWFTIMTTIGYGNTAPTTQEGRILVFTCGLLTIVGFVALNNTAANVWETLVDDVFLRLKWKKLVRVHSAFCFGCALPSCGCSFSHWDFRGIKGGTLGVLSP